MQIQFFPSLTEYGEGLEEREGSLGVFDLPNDFSPENQIAYLEEIKEGYKVVVSDKPPRKETPEEKKSRILSCLTLENIKKYNIEWVEFSDEEIGNIIEKLVFWGNRHAQIALNSKLMMMVLSEQKDVDLIKEAIDTQNKINKLISQLRISQ